MVDLPPLPVSVTAIQIALNGFTAGLLLPYVMGWLRHLTLRNLISLMVFALAIGLFIGNLIHWLSTPGVK